MAMVVHAGTVALDIGRVSYQLFRTPRRRHFHLVVSDDARLEVRAPYRCSTAEAESLIRSQQRWVTKALGEARKRVRERPEIRDGSLLPFAGERLRLEINPTQQGDFFRDHSLLRDQEVRRQGSSLQVCTASTDPDALGKLLTRWFRQHAKGYLRKRSYDWGELLGLVPARVIVGDARTQWGSCSSRGRISLNWRLVQVPSELCDYVLVHELCHLRELNHSKTYWALVADVLPDYKSRRQRLHGLRGQLAL